MGFRDFSVGLPALSLLAQSAYKVLLADCESLGPQNVIGRRGVKIKVGLRKGQQKILRSEFDCVVPHFKTHISSLKSVDLGRIERGQLADGGCKHLMQACKAVGPGRFVWRKHTLWQPLLSAAS